MIRGRFALAGRTRISLSDYCDVVWLEIWDDCSPMGDTHQYRRIVTELFIDGKDAYDIFYEVTEHDKKGRPRKKVKRLAASPSSVSRTQQMTSATTVLDQWRARSAELKAQREVASTPDG